MNHYTAIRSLVQWPLMASMAILWYRLWPQAGDRKQTNLLAGSLACVVSGACISGACIE